MPTHRQGRGGGGGGGSETQKVLYQKWPNQIFPMVNFRFFPRWSLWSGGGGSRGRGRLLPLPPMVYGHSNTALPPDPLHVWARGNVGGNVDIMDRRTHCQPPAHSRWMALRPFSLHSNTAAKAGHRLWRAVCVQCPRTPHYPLHMPRGRHRTTQQTCDTSAPAVPVVTGEIPAVRQHLRGTPRSVIVCGGAAPVPKASVSELYGARNTRVGAGDGSAL